MSILGFDFRNLLWPNMGKCLTRDLLIHHLFIKSNNFPRGYLCCEMFLKVYNPYLPLVRGCLAPKISKAPWKKGTLVSHGPSSFQLTSLSLLRNSDLIYLYLPKHFKNSGGVLVHLPLVISQHFQD